tara:strand:- start:812 stop:1915 length:1104 start_codon:yes stop_codon:yes gene_type:complete
MYKESVDEAGSPERLKMIKKIGNKYNKAKKRAERNAERDAVRHAKRDNEYQSEGKAEEIKGAAAANSGESHSNNPYPTGTPEHASWSKGHNSARSSQLNMGEAFTMKQYRKNEDENRHSENALQLAKKFGSKKEIKTIQDIHDRHMKRGDISEPDRLTRDKIAKTHYPKLKEMTSVKNTVEHYNWKVSHAGQDVHVKAPHAGAAVKKAQKGFGNKDLTKAKISNLGKVGTPAKNEETQFKVDVDGLPPTFMNGKSIGEILAKLRKIVKQPSMIKNVDRVTKHDVTKTYRDRAQGRGVDEAVDSSDTGGSEEVSMGIGQIKAMRHYLDGIDQRIKSDGDMEEWFQNKLTKANDYLKTLYGYGKGKTDE